MGWWLVFLAAAIEIVWASSIKYAHSIFDWAIVGTLIAVSFIMLIKAYKTIPVAMAYSVFVGIGTLGTYFVGIIIGEPFSFNQIFFLSLLLIGVIGLKITTKENSDGVDV